MRRLIIFFCVALACACAQTSSHPGGGSGGGSSPAGSDGDVQVKNGSSLGAGGMNCPAGGTTCSMGATVVGTADIAVAGISTPSGGSTFREYYVVCNLSGGRTTAGGNLYANVSDGPAALDSTHYITLTWSAGLGCVNYSVYTDDREGTPNSVGLLGTTALLTFRDNGVAGDGTPVYPANSSGPVSIYAPIVVPLTVKVLDSLATFGVYNAVVLNATETSNADSATTVSIEANDGGHNVGFITGLRTAISSTGTATSVFGQSVQTNVQTATNVFEFQVGPSFIGTAASVVGEYVNGPAVSGTVTTYVGFWSYIAGGAGTVHTYNQFFADIPTVTVDQGVFDFWGADLSSASSGTTNLYYEWFDSRGVFRIKEDSTFNSVGQAIGALYNPQFAKYTPGATDFERCIPGCQWESNVAVITTEKGGTGTLRNLQLGDAGVHVLVSDLKTTGSATGKKTVCVDTTTGQLYASSTGTDCSN